MAAEWYVNFVPFPFLNSFVLTVLFESSACHKVILVGDAGVGKSSLILQYAEQVWSEKLPSDIEGGFKSKVEVLEDRTRIQLDVWDTVVQERARGAASNHANAVFVVFDLTNRRTFVRLPVWLEGGARGQAGGLSWDSTTLKVLVGTKADLNDERNVSREEVEDFARRQSNVVYFETSATDHKSSCAPFRHVADTLWERDPQKVSLTLHRAAAGGRVEDIETLVRTGTQTVDTPDVQGWSPLHFAADSGHAKAIRALVRLGSQAIDAPTKQGETPIHLAAANRHVDVVETLVQLGSTSIDKPDKYGRTSLHVAAAKGHVFIIEALVRLGSQAIDTRDNDGQTPMHIAGSNREVGITDTLPLRDRAEMDVIKTLIRLGSEAINIPDRKRRMPLHDLHERAEEADVKAFEELFLLGSQMFKRDAALITRLLAAGLDLTLQPSKLQPSVTTTSSQLCLWQELLHVHPDLTEDPAFLAAQFYLSNPKRLVVKNATNDSVARLQLKNWTSCSTVDFRSNPNLTELPVSLAELDPEQTSKILFDPVTPNWSTYEAQVISRGDSREIIDNARLKAEGNKPISINERKLMAVGFAAVGKTTVIRRLRDENYLHPVSTDGVDMGELTLQTSESGEAIRVVVWDFAGQPLYRQTHLLFLRNPGLCLLLFKLTDDVNTSVEQLRYWCDTLFSITSGQLTQVLLVGTHLDRCGDRSRAQQHASEVWQRLQRFMPINEPPVLVSCADGRDNKRTIDELRTAILNAAVRMDIKVPACMEVVRKALLPATGINIPLLSSSAVHDSIIKYATKMNHARLQTSADLRERCLRALQVLGSVIVLEEGRRMTHLVTNPQWVALLVATVVTTRHTWAARGRVTFDTLSSQIWRGNRRFPPETHHTLVAILQQLKIMFAVNKKRGEPFLPTQVFFIPSSLPEHRSNSRFRAQLNSDARHSGRRKQHELRRVFMLTRAGQVIPMRVVPEIMLHLVSQPNFSFLEMWQQGGVFQITTEAGTVMVSVCRLASNSIEVIVKAHQSHLCLDWIRDVSTIVENQLTEVSNMEFEVRIPCGSEDDSCFVLLDDVRECVLNQKLQVSCRPSRKHLLRVDVLAPDLVFANLGSQTFVHQWSSINLIRQLGKGGFGRVMLGQLNNPSSFSLSASLSTIDPSPSPSLRLSSSLSSSSSSTLSSMVAVKLLEKQEQDKTNSIETYREFQHEAYLMSMLHHPNIVDFVGVCLPAETPSTEHERSPGLVMEVVDGGTLYYSVVDSVGISQACKLPVLLMKTIDLFNMETNQFQARPDRYQCPAPLLPLNQLCDGAMTQINQIFDERIFPLARRLELADAPEIRRMQELQQALNEQMTAYYTGPMTRELNQQTNQAIDDITAVNKRVIELLVPIDWPLRLKLATDVAQGLMHMHALTPPLVHRDFKSPNVFLMRRLDTVDLNTIDWRQPLAKVGDFGMSIRMLGMTDGCVAGHITPTWAAPEVLSNQGFGTEADVYAMGITMWELVAREHPFLNVREDQVARYVIEEGRPVVPDEWTSRGDVGVMQDYLALMERCWHPVPQQRPPMTEVFTKLRDLCRRAAPDIFASLPGAVIQPPAAEPAIHVRHKDLDYELTNVERLPIPAEGIEQSTKVTCLQSVGTDCFWAGLDNGSVVALTFNNSEGRWQATTCTATDRHQKPLTAMSFSPSQQMTVWSGSEDGQIFVWGANIDGLESARARCYLKSRFVLVESNVKKLVELKGQALFCIVRNGCMHMYLDEHVGSPCHQVDLCSASLKASIQTKSGHLELSNGSFRLVLQPINTSGDETAENPVPSWQRTISYLAQLASSDRGLSRLAASPRSLGQEFIKALEATDDATWCLTLTALIEWQLIDSQHGLHNQLRLEPGRQLTFDLDREPFGNASLRVLCGLAWVAPHVVWVGAANTIGCVDLKHSSASRSAMAASSSSSSSISERRACSECYQPHDGSCGEHLLQLGLSASSSAPLLSSRSGSSAPPPIPQTAAPRLTECSSCHLAFGLLRWRHECAGCRTALCGECRTAYRLCGRCRFTSQQALPPSKPGSTSTASSRQRSEFPLHWPSPDLPRHEAAILLLTLVECRSSASGLQVWTYSTSGEIFVWQTPVHVDLNGVHPNEQVFPLFLGRVEVSLTGIPQLTCMKQVGNQVWAGTSQGTIVGWDIESRVPISTPILPASYQHTERGRTDRDARPRSTTSIAVGGKNNRGMTALSSGQEPTLRRFRLVARR